MMNNPKRKCIHVREKTRSEEIFTNLVKRNVIMKMMLIQIQKKKKKKKKIQKLKGYGSKDKLSEAKKKKFGQKQFKIIGRENNKLKLEKLLE